MRSEVADRMLRSMPKHITEIVDAWAEFVVHKDEEHYKKAIEIISKYPDQDELIGEVHRLYKIYNGPRKYKRDVQKKLPSCKCSRIDALGAPDHERFAILSKDGRNIFSDVMPTPLTAWKSAWQVHCENNGEEYKKRYRANMKWLAESDKREIDLMLGTLKRISKDKKKDQ